MQPAALLLLVFGFAGFLHAPHAQAKQLGCAQAFFEVSLEAAEDVQGKEQIRVEGWKRRVAELAQHHATLGHPFVYSGIKGLTITPRADSPHMERIDFRYCWYSRKYNLGRERPPF